MTPITLSLWVAATTASTATTNTYHSYPHILALYATSNTLLTYYIPYN